MLPSEPPTADVARVFAEAEAARYALLRRLAPSMRHHLVVNLQPIGMIYEVMDRRLRAPHHVEPKRRSRATSRVRRCKPGW